MVGSTSSMKREDVIFLLLLSHQRGGGIMYITLSDLMAILTLIINVGVVGFILAMYIFNSKKNNCPPSKDEQLFFNLLNL